MTLWAIVPVKPLRRGKSRLAGTLSEDERTELNRSLLQNTLKTFAGLKEVEEVLVISRDPQALAIARHHGARTVREDGQPELNTALKRATVIAQVYATRGVLILPADLPLVTRDDVLMLADRSSGQASRWWMGRRPHSTPCARRSRAQESALIIRCWRPPEGKGSW